MLYEHGVTSQTVGEARPVRILPARCLSRIYSQKGWYLGYHSHKNQSNVEYFKICENICNNILFLIYIYICIFWVLCILLFRFQISLLYLLGLLGHNL